MMRDDQFEKLLNRLDMLIKITIAGTFRDKTKEESILLLSELGFKPNDIAPLLDTSPPYIRNVKSQTNKAKQEATKKAEEKKKSVGNKKKKDTGITKQVQESGTIRP